MSDPKTTPPPSLDEIEALADAMSGVLDDMGPSNQSVALYTKAKARLAYEPFKQLLDDDYDGYMPLAEATRIVKETDDGR